LSQIHRAIITAPDPIEIPNVDFTFLVNDHPASNIWSLSRSADPTPTNNEVNNTWLMPDYGFWSWPEPQIGTVDEVRQKIQVVEGDMSWAHKLDKAVWRGSVHWNSALRGKLIEVAQGRDWSDIQELDWSRNALNMEDFCKYKYLIYTEASQYVRGQWFIYNGTDMSKQGVTYSGRLRYFQLCRSIIISPPLQWRTHLSPLLQASGPEQNIVLVKEDWSDLNDVIEYLQTNPRLAERIANNTVNTFRDKYLGPAVEVCYWRKLFRAWAEVTDNIGVIPTKERGTRWESFMLMGALDWDKTA
jgi:hypothetical protein